eukprot:TRINITY_DN3349_c0_g1_i1.p1 TRINITY_DN3349_c0_g1~~TRINITY_DN3349_c0_g1_i1.p1  ORF type:complete len:988 (+),score=250.43 TRINITY_DN3349_c0_g1_i1:45-2966(+)
MRLFEGWDGTTDSAVDKLNQVTDKVVAEDRLRKKEDHLDFVRSFLFKLDQALMSEEVAEDFLSKGGLEAVVLALTAVPKGKKELLQIVHKRLLLFENAIDQFTEDGFLVGKIYTLLKGEDVDWLMAKEVLEILIVTVGATEKGLQLVHNTATKVGQSEKPYAPFASLLHSQDLYVLANVLAVLNILMVKAKEKEPQIAQELVSHWRRCGVLKNLKVLTDFEDPGIRKQFTVFQKLTGHIVPLSWYAAEQYGLRAEELRKKQQQAIGQLSSAKSIQPKAIIVNAEMCRCHSALEELRSQLTEADYQRLLQESNVVPKDWVDGGQMQAYSHKVFRDIATHYKPQMLEAAKDSIGKDVSWKKQGGADDVFAEIDSNYESEDSDIGRRNRFQGKKPHVADTDSSTSEPDGYYESSISSTEPPESEETSSYDDDAPPDDEPVAEFVAGQAGQGVQEVRYDKSGAPIPVSQGGASPAGVGGVGVSDATIASSDGTPQAPPPVGGVAPPPPAAAGGGPPPPPAAPAPPGAPPPPAGGGGPPRRAPPPRAKKAAEPQKEFYKGKKPEKKMKVMHWDTYPVGDNPTMWHKIHEVLGGHLDCSFDYDEFEAMFSQREAKRTGPVKEKPQAIILIDGKKFQNISIMMHKMPSIPEIQRAVKTLDNSALDRDKLEGLLSQVPTEDEEESFRNNMDKKPEEEYEPPEQFFAMVINSIEFTRRCKAWMFTIEWDENVSAAQKPIGLMQAACDCILNSKHLPLAMGMVLGFGNYMNAGSARGNAPGFTVATLSKLEMTRDTTGKLNLLQYVVHQVGLRDESALDLPIELAALQGVQKLKYDDIENGCKKLQGDLMKFKVQVKTVKEKLEANGVSEEEDPFVPKMTQFFLKAEGDFKAIEEMINKMKETFTKVLKYFGTPAKYLKKPDPDDFFSHLCLFVEKFGNEAAEKLKEKQRNAKKGKKLTVKGNVEGEGLEALANGIKEDLVNG